VTRSSSTPPVRFADTLPVQGKIFPCHHSTIDRFDNAIESFVHLVVPEANVLRPSNATTSVDFTTRSRRDSPGAGPACENASLGPSGRGDEPTASPPGASSSCANGGRSRGHSVHRGTLLLPLGKGGRAAARSGQPTIESHLPAAIARWLATGVLRDALWQPPSRRDFTPTIAPAERCSAPLARSHAPPRRGFPRRRRDRSLAGRAAGLRPKCRPAPRCRAGPPCSPLP
jgi:hypothetical protein